MIVTFPATWSPAPQTAQRGGYTFTPSTKPKSKESKR